MEDIQFFRDDNYLSSYPLSAANILEYFSFSPFYDNSCNNEVLRMQTQYQNVTTSLEDMVGIEYLLNHYNENNTLFIIYKINRTSNIDYTVLHVYYILYGTIYISPTDAKIFKSRLSNFYFYLNEAIDIYQQRRTFDIFTGYKIKDGTKSKEHINQNKDEEIDKIVLQEFNKIIKK